MEKPDGRGLGRNRPRRVSRLGLVEGEPLRHPLTTMLSIDLRIDRAQRLLRMIEEDAPLLTLRVAPLSSEHQRAARLHAERLAQITREEIQRLLEEKATVDAVELNPHAAD